MSASDRLDEIQARIDHSISTFGEDLLLPGDADAAALVAALRAVLGYVDHCEGNYFMRADDIREAVTAALGGAS